MAQVPRTRMMAQAQDRHMRQLGLPLGMEKSPGMDCHRHSLRLQRPSFCCFLPDLVGFGAWGPFHPKSWRLLVLFRVQDPWRQFFGPLN